VVHVAENERVIVAAMKLEAGERGFRGKLRSRSGLAGKAACHPDVAALGGKLVEFVHELFELAAVFFEQIALERRAQQFFGVTSEYRFSRGIDQADAAIGV